MCSVLTRHGGPARTYVYTRNLMLNFFFFYTASDGPERRTVLQVD